MATQLAAHRVPYVPAGWQASSDGFACPSCCGPSTRAKKASSVRVGWSWSSSCSVCLCRWLRPMSAAACETRFDVRLGSEFSVAASKDAPLCHSDLDACRRPLLLRERRYLLSDCSLLPLRGRRGHGRCEAGSSVFFWLFPNLTKCSSTNSFVTFVGCREGGRGDFRIVDFFRVIFLTLRVCGLRTGVYNPGRAEPGIILQILTPWQLAGPARAWSHLSYINSLVHTSYCVSVR